MINITFPDGSVRRFEDGVNAYAVAESISPRLRKATLAAELNGELYDAALPFTATAHLSCSPLPTTAANGPIATRVRTSLHRP